MNASAIAPSIMALGARLSRVPRRLAAVIALLAVLGVGGAGTLLAAAHPQLAPAATPGGGWARHVPRNGESGRAGHFERQGTQEPERPGRPGPAGR